MKISNKRTGLRDVSIAKKLYIIVGAMAVLIIIELFTLWFAIHTLSSVRAFITAEGLWSKAQKDGVFHLGKYHRTHNEAEYNAFMKFMEVPLGDHEARMELFKKDPDLDIVRKGFLKGRIHPEDIDGMIKLVTRFHDNYYISKALGYWGQGDSIISVLIPISQEMRREVASGNPSQDKLDQLSIQMDAINLQLTQLEDNFSFILGEGARWLENLILKIVFLVALTVEITGLVLTVLVTRNITKGLNEINRVADKITQGHFNERVTVFAHDEIGQVAGSVNRMTDQLVASNQELENFAYIASHDLQEPLRKIIMFTDILDNEMGETASEKAKQHMQKIIDSGLRMQRLIEDVLKFAEISSTIEYMPVDMNKLVAGVVTEMEITIARANAMVKVGPIPKLEANATQMEQLFQNLISNAIKFSKGSPEVNITAGLIDMNDLPGKYLSSLPARILNNKKPGNGSAKFCRILVKDNGIGFDETYLEKIFTAFQRLHGKHVYEGTGIGLAICQKIVETHHGMITAKSVLGEGATFIVILPVEQQAFKNIK